MVAEPNVDMPGEETSVYEAAFEFLVRSYIPGNKLTRVEPRPTTRVPPAGTQPYAKHGFNVSHEISATIYHFGSHNYPHREIIPYTLWL